MQGHTTQTQLQRPDHAVAISATHVQVVAILVSSHQQGAEGLGMLGLHLPRGVQEREASHAGHKGAAQHAHAQQAAHTDSCHKARQAQVDRVTCSLRACQQHAEAGSDVVNRPCRGDSGQAGD